MRRAVVVAITTFAVAAGCGSFGSDEPATPSNPDAAVAPPDGGTDVVGPDSSITFDEAGPSKPPIAPTTCPNIDDEFSWKGAIAAPWADPDTTADAKLTAGGELTVDTAGHAGSPNSHAMLKSVPFKPLKTLHCEFSLLELTPFHSKSGHDPIDLLIYALTYADGRQTWVRYSHADEQVSVRVDRFDAKGNCIHCPDPANTTSTTSEIEKDKSYDLELDVTPSVTSFGTTATKAKLLTLQLEPDPVSAQIWFGVWSVAEYAMTAQLDNLHCQLACE